MQLKSWQSGFYALLLHPTKAKVLILSRNDNYYLPYVEIEGEICFDDFQTIKEQIEQKLSISVNVLHYASYQIDRQQRHRRKDELFFYNDQKSQELCRDRYLSQWTQYESGECLFDVWKIAKPLCALHHAVTYQHISHSLEARTKQELNALPYFVRKIIKC